MIQCWWCDFIFSALPDWLSSATWFVVSNPLHFDFVLFFRTQIHDLHSGDHRPDVYAFMNCCTEQPSLILITILPIQPLRLMNFMHQSGRRFAKVFPAYQLLQVHCWGGKWGILKPERLGDLRKQHGDIIGIPSGKRLHNYGKSPFWMGKLTINGHFQ